MVRCAVSLGSNVGDSVAYVEAAIAALGSRFHLLAASSLYRTAPMYVENQADFVNAAALIEVDLGPRSLLAELKAIEREIGRSPAQRNGPREIDLDLITYGALRYCYREAGKLILQIPHPRIAERRFVLQPLNDLQPAATIPGLGSVKSLLKATESDAGAVRKIKNASIPILCNR